MAFIFSIKTVVQGYHTYKEISNAAMDRTELPCEREIDMSLRKSHQLETWPRLTLYQKLWLS